MKPLVYIASALTKGDCGVNVHFQCEMFHKMTMDGIVVPFAPLMTFVQQVVFQMSYESWLEWDNVLLARCDALVRLVADYRPMNYRQRDSAGADAEVDLARSLGIPVFFDIDKLYEWSRTEWKPRTSESLKPGQSDVQGQTAPGST